METGNIVIYRSDDVVLETIGVTSSKVTGTGTTTITINPDEALQDGTEYYVQIDATAFDDTSGNSYAGIVDETTWNITTSPVSSSGSGGRGLSRSAQPLPSSVPAGSPTACPLGHIFSIVTGQRCTTWTAPTYAFGTVLVKLWSRGDACKAWQTFLNTRNANLVLDGVCGPLTMAAARAWQASVGLVADGLLGPLSRAKAME